MASKPHPLGLGHTVYFLLLLICLSTCAWCASLASLLAFCSGVSISPRFVPPLGDWLLRLGDFLLGEEEGGMVWSAGSVAEPSSFTVLFFPFLFLFTFFLPPPARSNNVVSFRAVVV